MNTTKIIADASPLKATHGLSPSEMLALILMLENRLTPSEGLSSWSIASDMEKGGFTKAATVLALVKLLQKGFAAVRKEHDSFNEWDAYLITDNGLNWCLQNESHFKLTIDPALPDQELKQLAQVTSPAPNAEEEDIPF
jgi:hypothetical protein